MPICRKLPGVRKNGASLTAAVQLVQEVLTGRGTTVLGLLLPECDRFLRLSDSSRRPQGTVQLTGSDDNNDVVLARTPDDVVIIDEKTLPQ